MSDPPADDEESSSADRDTGNCNTSDRPLRWELVADRLRLEYPNRVSMADAARILQIRPSGIRHHLSRLGDVEWVSIGGRTFRTFDRQKVIQYSKQRQRIRISRCAFQGIEVERLERICETYYRQNLDIASPELLALAKRIAKL